MNECPQCGAEGIEVTCAGDRARRFVCSQGRHDWDVPLEQKAGPEDSEILKGFEIPEDRWPSVLDNPLWPIVRKIIIAMTPVGDE